MKRALCLLVLTVVAGVLPATGCHAQGSPAPPGAALLDGRGTLHIYQNGLRSTLQVEIVASVETRSRGLMFRTSLPEDAGMLFAFEADGRVVLAEELFVRGKAVVLDHGNGVFTGYWHLSALDVAEGDVVMRGQLLGKVGSTGLSTGAHLHWELRIAGMAVDPLQWVEP